MSAIEWTEQTWNPVTGCTKVSPECAHCYIERTPPFRIQGRRFVGGTTGVLLHPDRLEPHGSNHPLRRRKPTMYFVCSLADLFHEAVPDSFIARVFDVMARAPQHTFQVLTKRPERMRTWMTGFGLGSAIGRHEVWPLRNVWCGTSIGIRSFVHRTEDLRQTPAAVRFISAEPLLGPLAPWLDLSDIDWLIVGGESGPHIDERPYRFLIDPQTRAPRPDRLAWVRDLRDDALFNDTAFFFKQWGGRTPRSGGRVLDGRTWDELPIWRHAPRRAPVAEAVAP